MLRSAASKAMWLAKGMALFWGAVLTLAMMLGAASVAFGANGGNLILGQNNAATLLTKLTGNVNGPAMQVQNTNAGANDQALSLVVNPGEAPMRVNSDGRVANLNSDKLDGKDSGAFLGVDAKARDAARADFASFAGEAQNAQVAGDSDKLDGKNSTDFLSRTYAAEKSAPGKGGGTVSSLDVRCAPGDKVLGGGGAGGIEDALSVSRPTNLRDGWFVFVVDNGSASTLAVDAICADLPPLLGQ